MLITFIIGFIVSGIVYGIRFSIWSKEIPPMISSLRWVIAIIIGILAIIIEVGSGLDTKGVASVNAFLVYIVAQALKNEPKDKFIKETNKKQLIKKEKASKLFGLTKREDVLSESRFSEEVIDDKYIKKHYPGAEIPAQESKKCPNCGLFNPENAQTCDCGFIFN